MFVVCRARRCRLVTEEQRGALATLPPARLTSLTPLGFRKVILGCAGPGVSLRRAWTGRSIVSFCVQSGAVAAQTPWVFTQVRPDNRSVDARLKTGPESRNGLRKPG